MFPSSSMFSVILIFPFAVPNGLGLTPPMGWNPYNHMKSTGFTWFPNETIVRAQAEALRSTGLRALGYKYVNLDAGWSLRDRDSTTGRPQPDPQKFPNIANGGLASFLNALGFEFGIYSDSGTLHCGGAGPGGLGHEKIDAQAYVEWGVSYLKYDNCFVPPNITCVCCLGLNTKMDPPHNPASDGIPSAAHHRDVGPHPAAHHCGRWDPIPRYTAMSEALNATGKPVFFNMCEWGYADPARWGGAVANSWRTTADISDMW